MCCCSKLSCCILKYEGKVRSIKGKWEAPLCKTRFLTLSEHSWVTDIRNIFLRFPCHYLDSFLKTIQVSWNLMKMIKTTYVGWPIDGWAPEYQCTTDWATKQQVFLVSTKLLSSKTLEWILWTSTFHSDPPYVQTGVLISLLTRQNLKYASLLSYPSIAPFQGTVADATVW